MLGRIRRWTGWAQALRAKHARLAVRHHPAAMALSRPRAPWMLAPSFHTNPQISFTVRMQNAPAPVQPRVAPVHRRELPVPAQRTPLQLRNAPVQPSIAPVTQIVAARPQALAPLTAKAAPPRWDIVLTRRSIATHVLMQTRRVEELVRTLCSATTPAHPPAEIAQRVTRQSARYEERPAAQAMALRPQLAPAMPEAQRAPLEQPRIEREWNRSHPTPPPIMTPNIDTLTTQVMDQIDRRVIAWRERMGKF